MRLAQKLACGLVAVGTLAAGAALFGPSERLNGIDLGAVGASVFMLCVLASIGLFATSSDKVFPDHMSIAERRAWVGLVFLAIVLATFIREMLALSGHATIPETIHDLFARRFIERYVLLAIAWAVISHLIGRGDRIEADERDLQLRHRADRAGDWALTLMVINAVAVLALIPRQVLHWWLAPIVLANVLIGLLIAKALVEHLVLAYSYRSQQRA